MADFRELIERDTREYSNLHRAVKESFKNRLNNLPAWEEACEKFHAHQLKIDPYIDRVYDEELVCQELQEFVITFLELDPMFFRSGYIKQVMLTKIKRAALCETQKERLRKVVVSAVDQRPYREYRYYCHLAVKILNKKLLHAIEVIAREGEGARKSRAKYMCKHIEHVVV